MKARNDRKDLESISKDSYSELFSHVSLSQNQIEPSHAKTIKIGYLITIPYWAEEKNSIQEIIDLFDRDAFEAHSSQDLEMKIAIVIGVNQKEGGQIAIQKSDFIIQSSFFVKVIYFTWQGKKVNYGDINNYIKESQAAEKLILNLKQHGCNYIYYAKFDADTIALNQCFTYYGAAIKSYHDQHNKLPAIVTSGYITKHNSHGLELGVLLDYISRMSVARHLPFSPYITEANALILLPASDSFLKERYGEEREMSGMLEQVINERKLDPYAAVLFVKNTPITTAYRPVRMTDANYFKGILDVDGKYTGWISRDLDSFSKIWQTHYKDDQKFYEDRLKNDLRILFSEFEGHTLAHKRVGPCIGFLILNINRCFDPISRSKSKISFYDYVRNEPLEITNALLDQETLLTLKNVLDQYTNIVGWRRPGEQGPTPYRLGDDYPYSHLHININNAPQGDPRLSDLMGDIYLYSLKERFKTLLAIYAFISKYKVNLKLLRNYFLMSLLKKNHYL
jgi:hypothetical protein